MYIIKHIYFRLYFYMKLNLYIYYKHKYLKKKQIFILFFCYSYPLFILAIPGFLLAIHFSLNKYNNLLNKE